MVAAVTPPLAAAYAVAAWLLSGPGGLSQSRRVRLHKRLNSPLAWLAAQFACLRVCQFVRTYEPAPVPETPVRFGHSEHRTPQREQDMSRFRPAGPRSDRGHAASARRALWCLLLLAGVGFCGAVVWAAALPRVQYDPQGNPLIANDRRGVPTWPISRDMPDDVFTFVRIKYSGLSNGYSGWATDYPDSDLNITYRLQQAHFLAGRSHAQGSWSSPIRPWPTIRSSICSK